MAAHDKNIRTVKVAALQLTAAAGSPSANNQHAIPFIEEAVRQGASLVVLPETYSSGYRATAEIWNAAETVDGPTSEWLKETAKRLDIYLGTGFVETDGEDFYNAYMLSDPDGKIIGINRKRNAEAYAFRSGSGPHVFETELGRIAVGICADNQFPFLQKIVHEQSADILLMPHAAPLQKRIEREKTTASNYKKIENQYARMKHLPHIYADMFGIPVIFATQFGALERLPGLIGKAMSPEKWWLSGISRIVDSDGTLRAELGDGEGIAVAEVTLDPYRKQKAREKYDGKKYFTGFSAFARRVIFPIDGVFAHRSYNKSKRNRKHPDEQNAINGRSKYVGL